MTQRDRLVVVRQGDCLASLAARHGLPDAQSLYDHPANEALRSRRASPHVLEPGDVVAIPPSEGERPRCHKGTTNRYVGRRARVALKIRLREAGGGALAGRRYELEVGADTLTGTIGADGLVNRDVDPSAQQARLRIYDDSGETVVTTLALAVGHLDPIDTESGLRARLLNLGMREHAEDPRAVEAFQRSEGLTISGELDAATQARLRELHGI